MGNRARFVLSFAVLLAACNPHASKAPGGDEQTEPGAAPAREARDSAAPGSATVISPSDGTRPTDPPTSDEVRARATGGADRAPVAAEPADEFTQVDLPAGTTLPASLETALSSATSHVEDAVRARVTSPVRLGTRVVVPAGATLSGTVTEATPSGKVKGRGRVAVRFHTLVLHDAGEYRIHTHPIAREARATKKKDATTIGVGAAAGAVVGGLLGGGKGAAVGTAVGGGAGTAMVLTQRGEEVNLPTGTALVVRLSDPVSVRVRAHR